MIDVELDDKLKEECGVLGVYAPGQRAELISFFALFALQHRGQESAGLAVSDGERVKVEVGMGLVNKVFDEELLRTLPGFMAVGHTRYSTTGDSIIANAQPIKCLSEVGDIAVAHNGNLINAEELRAEMEAAGEQFKGTTDSEVLARILVNNLDKGIENAVSEVMRRVKGAYSVTVLTPSMLIGFRDPAGIRPLVFGTLDDDGYVIASETCAFTTIGATTVRELEPGEMVIIDSRGPRFKSGAKSEKKAMCLFELIYFARPDSVMYGTLIYSARERMGAQLARRDRDLEADIVIPVPDSGVPAALGYSREKGLLYQEGMIKSRYIHRTFIQPDQRMRELGVKMKLSPLVEHLEGKRVVLVDDSIVRGTTTKQIVKLIFDSGAKEVHVRITAPPIKFPCFYGIDMARSDQLAAAIMSLEALTEYLGATSLSYLTVEEAMDAVGRPHNTYCTACFTGNYPIGIPAKAEKGLPTPAGDTGQMSAFSQQPVLIEL